MNPYGPGPGRWRAGNVQEKCVSFPHFYEKMSFLASRQCFLIVLTCSWVFWPKNDTERIWNYLKKPVLDPKCAELNQKSSFWRLVSVSWGGGNPQDTGEQYTQTVIKDKMTHEWFLVFSECWICPVHLGFESISVYYIVAQDGAMATQTNQFIVFTTRYGWSDYLSHTLA